MKDTNMFTNPRLAFGSMGILLLSITFAVVGGAYAISVYNTQVSLQNHYEAKLKANEADLSNLKSKLPEAASVTDAQMNRLEELFTGYAESRSPDGGGALMQWVTEAIPNIDQTTYTNLQNVIVSARDDWTARQKELVDISRAYNENLRTQPRGFVLGIFGDFDKIEPLVISTAATKEAFATDGDEPMNLFPEKGNIER